jgi:hypothetical protein
MHHLEGRLVRVRGNAGLTDGGTLLVYRDRIVPRSEAHFLRRQYVGFRHLAPIWIGCRADAGLGELGAEPMLLGDTAPLARSTGCNSGSLAASQASRISQCCGHD